MGEQRHRIKRQLIELQVQRQADAWPLQTAVSRIYRQRLLPMIEECCTVLSKPNQCYRIETLTLDLGALDPEHLEEELIERLRVALPPALAAQLSVQEERAGSQAQPIQTQAQLELLTAFVCTGTLPWWADADNPRLLADCLAHLLEQAPDALRQLLQAVGADHSALQRLIQHYADEQLALLAALLLPAFPPALHQAPPMLLALLAQTQAGDRSGSQRRRSFWANLLSTAALPGETYPTPVAFYAAVLRRVALALALPYRSLLAALLALLPVTGTDEERAFRELLEQLYRSEALPELTDRAAGAQAVPPVGVPTEQSVDRYDRDLTNTPLAAPDDKPMDRLAARTLLGQVALPQSRLTAIAGIEKRATARRSRLPGQDADVTEGTADEVYVGNAGLVLLWPFLGHFFTRLGLLVEQQFKDEAARQRAVGLLQHLATGATDFPEYLLPLNKLLCGLDLAQLFDFGAPLTDGEADEAPALLRAVIEHAPILRDMTPTGLQGTFLLRQGVLRTGAGAWLLQVERESYEVVLERFPWSWEWVKLPWMAVPLRVEW
ncbi:MAG: contractile injection system tape measure protein [Caldilineaceae bacterium]